VVVLSALVLASTQAAVQQASAAREKTENLLSLLQDSNATVTEIFRQLRADGKTIPQVSLDEYDQALVLAQESQNLLQAGNYSAANSKIIAALQKFKEAVRIVYATFPEKPSETEIALERAVELKSSINRYYEQLARIENLTRLASTDGYNITVADKIQTVRSLLETATSNVEQKRFEVASENLVEAKSLIDSTASFFNNLASDLKTDRIATYISQTQERLDAIRVTATSLSNTASLAALDSAETSLNSAKEYLAEQRINETLSALASSKASEVAAVEYLKPSTSSVAPTSSNTASTVRSP
jgi:hypothetical protein